MPTGHLFVVDSDLRKIHCDAWLLPTDKNFSITDVWIDVVGLKQRGRLAGLNWPNNSRVLFFGKVNDVDVWLANIGNEAGDTQIFADAAGDFIREAVQKLRDETPNAPETWVPRLALNHIGTGRGGAKFKKWQAIKEVTNRIKVEIQNSPVPVDVIQVAFQEKAEAAAQNIREKSTYGDVRSDPSWLFYLDNEDKHEIARDLANEMKLSNVAVFMGAGVSAGAGLSNWETLLETLRRHTTIDKSLFDEVVDNRDKAEILRMSLGDEQFRRGLSRALASPKFSLQHALLSSLPIKEFITTNVDTLFEMACESQQKPLAVLPNLEQHQLADRWLLKIHGSISDENSMVFTRQNYLDSFRSNRALLGVLQASLLTRHLLFVGYGLKDEDFHELLHEVRNAFPNGKPERLLGTVLTLFSDPLRDNLLRDVVRVVPMRERPQVDPSTNAGRKILAREESLAIRDLEKFLDLLGMLSSDKSAFLLDVQFREDWSPEESELADLLQDVLRRTEELAVNGINQHGTAWTSLRSLLQSLGADFTSHSQN